METRKMKQRKMVANLDPSKFQQLSSGYGHGNSLKAVHKNPLQLQARLQRLALYYF